MTYFNRTFRRKLTNTCTVCMCSVKNQPVVTSVFLRLIEIYVMSVNWLIYWDITKWLFHRIATACRNTHKIHVLSITLSEFTTMNWVLKKSILSVYGDGKVCSFLWSDIALFIAIYDTFFLSRTRFFRLRNSTCRWLAWREGSGCIRVLFSAVIFCCAANICHLITHQSWKCFSTEYESKP